ncbi:MAG: glycosyltransferase [Erysipelotrichaceae bacterium]|jgi:glycosyltransferase involved in cell wall biosynthesis|nr:glycosyltransferase [Erysipelotrichaceae bacterium]
MKNYVFLSTGASLPNQNASALRIMSIAKTLAKNGNNCFIVGQTGSNESEIIKISENISLYSLYNYKIRNSISNKFKTFLFSTKKILGSLDAAAKVLPKIDCIVIYQQLDAHTTKKIIKYCKERQIMLAFDIVEFQTLSQQNIFTFFQFYLPNLLTVNRYSKNGRVIAISSYLDNYLKRRNVKSIFVPLFLDLDTVPYFQKHSLFNDDGIIKIVYAGSPARGRDSIVSAVRGLLSLEEEKRSKFHLDIAGCSEKGILKLGLTQKELEISKRFVSYLGRINHEEVEKLYKEAKFSIYLKPAHKRFSKAGFPTKMTESWAYGTPVIANLSGDLSLFVNEKNSIIIESDSPAAFKNGLERILKLDDYPSMSIDSRTTAEEKLDQKVFTDTILTFMEGK